MMIKIAYVINYIVKNGPSSVILNIINHLDKKRYDISLITLFYGNNPDVVQHLQAQGVHVFQCVTLSRLKCMLGESKEFDILVKKQHFDILHTHGLIPDLLASRLKDPVKKISTIHNNMYEDYLDTYGYLKSRIFIQMHLHALKRLDLCVCCSKSVYDVMKYKLKNTVFIRNGIEPVQAHSAVTREKLGLPKDATVFLYAGVLSSRKNVLLLTNLFAQYHNTNEYLLILGKGEKLEECKQVADDHIQFLGFQTDIAAYMNISDVYVSASKSEGFSISVLEALSCGLGLFLSDIPSHHEVISMADTCYIGEVFTETSFQSQLDQLRKNYCQLKREAIENWQKEKLSASYMSGQYMNQYEKVME